MSGGLLQLSISGIQGAVLITNGKTEIVRSTIDTQISYTQISFCVCELFRRTKCKIYRTICKNDTAKITQF